MLKLRMLSLHGLQLDAKVDVTYEDGYEYTSELRIQCVKTPYLGVSYLFIYLFYYKVCWVLHVLQLGKGRVAGVP
jgi:hypothetical protein